MQNVKGVDMKIIIPVAGEGSRLRPHTHTIPKVLINIAGKPIISYIIEKLNKTPDSEFIFILGYLGEKIKEFVISEFPENKFSFVFQKERQGLGHAVSLAGEYIKPDDKVLIVLGDTIFDTDYSFLKEERSVLAVKKVDNPSRFGVAVVKEGRITKLIEKPKDFVSDLALVGIYYIKRWDILKRSLEHIFKNNIRTKNEFQLTDALEHMIQNGEELVPHEIEGWFDCGKPETLISTNKHLLSKNHIVTEVKNSVIIPPCFIPVSAQVENSIIGPYVSVGENVIIKSSIIKNSIVDKDAEIYCVNLENSLIGGRALIKGHPRSLNVGDSSEVIF